MDIHSRLRRWFKLRFAIVYPLGAYVVFFAIPDDNSLRIGTWFILSGLFLRLWSNGYAVKLKKLTTSGPYAFIRHPLYLGTMLIALGFVIMLKIYYIGILFLLVMAGVYYKTMKNEDRMLGDKFGETYINYKKKVSAIIPTFFPYGKGEKWPFSFKRLIKSQEYKTFFWMLILVMAFHLKDEFMVEQESLEMKSMGLIVLMFVLAITDLVGEYVKSRKRKVM